jgi:hypothetical protein
MIPALRGNELAFAATWLGTVAAGAASILAMEEVVPTQPAVYVGLGALATALIGLVVPLVKMYADQRDKDRQALMESTRVAAEMRSAFVAIGALDHEVKNILANQEEFLRRHPQPHHPPLEESQ